MTMTPWIKTLALTGTLLAATGAFGGAHAGDRMDRKIDEKLAAHFEKLDTNKDGTISYDEMMAHTQAEFAKFDKDGNAFLELAELPKEMPVPEHRAHRMEKMKVRMAKRAEERGIELDEDDMAGHETPTRIQFVAKLDRDGDEKVSLDEFARKPIRHFKQADLNGNGAVTREEAAEAVKHRFEGMRDGRHKRDGEHHGKR